MIVGGGHNALTAAAYLARAGVEVTVLERLDNVGGAAISATAFTGLDARLSRYAYLVSLLPRSIADDLELDVSLVRRRYSSYPVARHRPRPADRQRRRGRDPRLVRLGGRRRRCGPVRRLLPAHQRLRRAAVRHHDRSATHA
ncbi:MAG: FAD-dependent oxidoreductase [Micropruina glycogenica]